MTNNVIKRVPPLRKKFFYTNTYEGIYLQSMLRHRGVKGYPEREGVLTSDITPTEQDKAITKRLVRAYKKATQDHRRNGRYRDIWTVLGGGHHAEFISLLETEDVEKLAFTLCNMSRLGISQGLVQGTDEYQKLHKFPTFRSWLTLSTADKLVSLAEALGVLPYENPEQGEYGSAILADVDAVAEKVEDYLGISLSPPNIEGGLYKLATRRGSIHARDITALYTAWRCREILRGIKDPPYARPVEVLVRRHTTRTFWV